MRRSLIVSVLLVACGGPPSFSESAALTLNEQSPTHLSFSWPAAEGDVAAYIIRVDGEDEARVGADTTEYRADELEEATEHVIEVVAANADGAESGPLLATGSTTDGTAPTFEADAEGLIGSLTPITVRVDDLAETDWATGVRTVHLSWPRARDAVGVTRYQIMRDQAEVGLVEAPTTELTLTDIVWGAPTTIEVRAFDAADNVSDPGLTTRWTPSSAEPIEPAADGDDEARQLREREMEVERARRQVEQMLLDALGADSLVDAFNRPGVMDPDEPADGVEVDRRTGGLLRSREGGAGGLVGSRNPSSPSRGAAVDAPAHEVRPGVLPEPEEEEEALE